MMIARLGKVGSWSSSALRPDMTSVLKVALDAARGCAETGRPCCCREVARVWRHIRDGIGPVLSLVGPLELLIIQVSSLFGEELVYVLPLADDGVGPLRGAH